MTTGTDGTLLIRITRPEGYDDVHPDLVLVDCGVKPEFLPEIVDASQLSAARLEGWRAGIEDAAQAVKAEALEDPPDNEGDEAYSQAVLDCLAAIRSLPEPEAP